MTTPTQERRNRLRHMMTSGNDVAVDRMVLQGADLDALRALLDGYERRGALLQSDVTIFSAAAEDARESEDDDLAGYYQALADDRSAELEEQ